MALSSFLVHDAPRRLLSLILFITDRCTVMYGVPASAGQDAVQPPDSSPGLLIPQMLRMLRHVAVPAIARKPNGHAGRCGCCGVTLKNSPAGERSPNATSEPLSSFCHPFFCHLLLQAAGHASTRAKVLPSMILPVPQPYSH